jgi:hypothetical protein
MLDSLVRVSRWVGWVTDWMPLISGSISIERSGYGHGLPRPASKSRNFERPHRLRFTSPYGRLRLSKTNISYRPVTRRRRGELASAFAPRFGRTRHWSRRFSAESALSAIYYESAEPSRDRPAIGSKLAKLISADTWQLHPFTSKRFHALLNSLFKVLFNFPSRYLFAIGLVVIFSLRWGLPPTLGCTLKQPDSPENYTDVYRLFTGLTPTTGTHSRVLR